MPYFLLKQVHDAAARWKLCGFASWSKLGSRHSLDLIDGCAVPRDRIATCMEEMVQWYGKCWMRPKLTTKHAGDSGYAGGDALALQHKDYCDPTAFPNASA
jgi:hypothetical protein